MKLQPFLLSVPQSPAEVSRSLAFRSAFAPGANAGDNRSEYSWYEPSQTARPYPVPPVKAVRFGVIPHPYCGVCPICVAGAAARAEVSKIGELREGKDIDVSVEEASQSIREIGSATGADVGRTAIGNEDGTRLQPFAHNDLRPAAIAALPRLYNPDGRSYKLDYKPSGINHGIYKAVTGSQVVSDDTDGKTFDYSCAPDAPPPPMENDPARPIIPAYKRNARDWPMQTFGIYHHIAEGEDARFTRRSQPLLLGYATLVRPRKDEVVVLSLRELPRFERLGIEAGGLMNVLGAAAKQKDVQSVAVVVEPWQKGLAEYIEELKSQHGLDVQDLNAEALPDAYLDLLKNADLPLDTRVVRIGLAPLKSAWASIDASLPPGERDTELLKTIALSDAIRDGEPVKAAPSERDLSMCPPLSRINLKGPDPDLSLLEIEEPAVPEIPTPDLD